MIKVKVEAEGVTIERELTAMQWAQIKGIMTKLHDHKEPTGPLYMVGAGGGIGAGGAAGSVSFGIMYGVGGNPRVPPGRWVSQSGWSYEEFRAAGWTDEDLIKHGHIKT